MCRGTQRVDLACPCVSTAVRPRPDTRPPTPGQFGSFRGGKLQYRHYLVDACGKILLMVLLAAFAVYPAAQTQIASVIAMLSSAITILNSPYNCFKKNTNEVSEPLGGAGRDERR